MKTILGVLVFCLLATSANATDPIVVEGENCQIVGTQNIFIFSDYSNFDDGALAYRTFVKGHDCAIMVAEITAQFPFRASINPMISNELEISMLFWDHVTQPCACSFLCFKYALITYHAMYKGIVDTTWTQQAIMLRKNYYDCCGPNLDAVPWEYAY